MTKTDDFIAELRAIAANEMDPSAPIAARALNCVGQLVASLAASKGATERAHQELAIERARIKALDNTVHNLDRRVNESWRLLNDASAVLLRAEAAIPTEQRDALDVVDAFLLRLKPPAQPAKETPK